MCYLCIYVFYFTCLFTYAFIYLLTCCSVAVLIRERFRARRLRRASKLLRPSPRQLPRGSSHLKAPEALGAAISRLQRLWEQPSRGSRGSGSSHLEAPEALEAAKSRPQRLLRPQWLQPQFSRVFSSILELGDLSGSSPHSSGKLEEVFRRL